MVQENFGSSSDIRATFDIAVYTKIMIRWEIKNEEKESQIGSEIANVYCYLIHQEWK